MRAATFFKYFLPVIIWMGLIFGGSTDLGAPRNTSRLIGPILRWLNPNVTDVTINRVQFIVRKCGHAAEYGILCLLIWRAIRSKSPTAARPWNWRDARLAILFSACYASTDEFHQYFVVSREASLRDVLIDTGGAIASMFLLWEMGRWFKRW